MCGGALMYHNSHADVATVSSSSGRNKNTEPELGILAYPRGNTHDLVGGDKRLSQSRNPTSSWLRLGC